MHAKLVSASKHIIRSHSQRLKSIMWLTVVLVRLEPVPMALLHIRFQSIRRFAPLKANACSLTGTYHIRMCYLPLNQSDDIIFKLNR